LKNGAGIDAEKHRNQHEHEGADTTAHCAACDPRTAPIFNVLTFRFVVEPHKASLRDVVTKAGAMVLEYEFAPIKQPRRVTASGVVDIQG
jgi:hypothetical protein